MYAINKTSNNKNTSKNHNKSFCKVCHDAGKSENEYTSHGLKNERGIVICPILLEQCCRYCDKKGHTVKYCPTLSKNTKEDKKQENKKEYFKRDTNVKAIKDKNIKKNKNFFMALCDDSSDEEHKKISNNKNNQMNKKSRVVDNFPALSSTKQTKNNTNINTLNFKNIISITQEQEAKEKALKEEEEIFRRLNTKKINHKEIQVIAPPETTIAEAVTRKRNWADVYSSDEEEDEEEEKEYQSNYRDKLMANYHNPYDNDSDDDF
jgi:hypothetical protein